MNYLILPWRHQAKFVAEDSFFFNFDFQRKLILIFVLVFHVSCLLGCLLGRQMAWTVRTYFLWKKKTKQKTNKKHFKMSAAVKTEYEEWAWHWGLGLWDCKKIQNYVIQWSWFIMEKVGNRALDKVLVQRVFYPNALMLKCPFAMLNS